MTEERPRTSSRPTPRRGALSLLLTGTAEIWSALRAGEERPGERAGLALMLASAGAFALMAAVSKLFLPDTPTQAIVLSRGLLMTLVFVALARRERVSMLGRRPRVLCLRGLLGYGAVSCYFYSVQALPLGDAVLLQYSHPVFVAALAPLLLGERVAPRHWLWVLAAFAGLGLIVGPRGEIEPSALVGLAGALLSGLAYMTVRGLSRTEHPLTILVWFPAVTIPGSLIATIAAEGAGLPRSAWEIAGHLLVTVCALAGQLALTQGLARARAAQGTAITMAGPVFGLLFGFVFFGTLPTAASLAGTALVIVALILLAR